MSNEAFEYKDSGLKTLMKLLQDNASRVKVGIPTDNDSRKETNSNATIGLKHEMGLGVPQRSFLRMPLTEKLQEFIDKSHAFDKDALTNVLKTKSLNPWLKKLGLIGEDVIAEAFATGGFGKWPASDMKNKKVHMTLVESTQLRESITSLVDE